MLRLTQQQNNPIPLTGRFPFDLMDHGLLFPSATSSSSIPIVRSSLDGPPGSTDGVSEWMEEMRQRNVLIRSYVQDQSARQNAESSAALSLIASSTSAASAATATTAENPSNNTALSSATSSRNDMMLRLLQEQRRMVGGSNSGLDQLGEHQNRLRSLALEQLTRRAGINSTFDIPFSFRSISLPHTPDRSVAQLQQSLSHSNQLEVTSPSAISERIASLLTLQNLNTDLARLPPTSVASLHHHQQQRYEEAKQQELIAQLIDQQQSSMGSPDRKRKANDDTDQSAKLGKPSNR
jgi:hypothetical protein